MTGAAVITVLVASDVRLYREGLAESLKRHPSLDVIGTALRPDDAVRKAAELGPSMVLVDHAMADSLRTVRLITEARPDVLVIVLGVLESDEQVIACAEAGAAGYVTREASLQELVGTIESAARGELRCSARIAATLLRQVTRGAARRHDTPERSRLTSRELEIVRLIEQGLSNKEIAARLGIQLATVKNHVHNLLDKLRVRHRTEAAARVRGAARASALRSARE